MWRLSPCSARRDSASVDLSIPTRTPQIFLIKATNLTKLKTIPVNEKCFVYIDSKSFATDLIATMEDYSQTKGCFEIDWERVKASVGGYKAYFYECPLAGKLEDYETRLKDAVSDAAKRTSLEEKLEDLRLQEAQQNKLFRELRSIPGYHLRLGVLSRSDKKAQQKMVDVQLAVDMLTHASNGACKHFHLFASDSDFVPVVEALTHLGHWVTVWGFPRSMSQHLVDAADHRVLLDPEKIFEMGLIKEPQRSRWAPPTLQELEDKGGWEESWEDGHHAVEFIENVYDAENNELSLFRAIVYRDPDNGAIAGYVDNSWRKLYAYLRHKHGEVSWPELPWVLV